MPYDLTRSRYTKLNRIIRQYFPVLVGEFLTDRFEPVPDNVFCLNPSLAINKAWSKCPSGDLQPPIPPSPRRPGEVFA